MAHRLLRKDQKCAGDSPSRGGRATYLLTGPTHFCQLGSMLWKPAPLGEQVSESGEEAIAKAGPLPRERLKHGGQRRSELYDYRDGTHYCCDILAGSQGLGAGMAEQIRKAQKLGPGHPQPAPLTAFFISDTKSNSFLPASWAGTRYLRLFLFCTFRTYPASSPIHPAASFPFSCHMGAALPASTHACLSPAQRKLSKVTSHHSSAPNPPRPSCHRSWELKPCPCWALKTSC